jgi:hypothetical protein
MISFKKPSQKRIKKTASPKKSHISKKRKKVTTTGFRNSVFNSTYKFLQTNFLLPKKSPVVTKKPRILNLQPQKFITCPGKNKKKSQSFGLKNWKRIKRNTLIKRRAKNANLKKRLFLLRRSRLYIQKSVRRKKTFLFFLPNVISRKRYIRRKVPRKKFKRIVQKLYSYRAKKKMKPKLPTVLRKKKPLKKKDLVRGNKTSINKKTVTATTRLFPELKRSRSLRRSSKRSFRRPRRMY